MTGTLTVFLILLLAPAAICALVAGKVASDRGHDPGGLYLAGLFLGPLGVAAALAAPYTPERIAAAIADADRHRSSPSWGVPPASQWPSSGNTAMAPDVAHPPRQAAPEVPHADDRRRPDVAGLLAGRWRVVTSRAHDVASGSVLDVSADGNLLVFACDGRAVLTRHRSDLDAWRREDDGHTIVADRAGIVLALEPFR